MPNKNIDEEIIEKDIDEIFKNHNQAEKIEEVIKSSSSQVEIPASASDNISLRCRNRFSYESSV